MQGGLGWQGSNARQPGRLWRLAVDPVTRGGEVACRRARRTGDAAAEQDQFRHHQRNEKAFVPARMKLREGARRGRYTSRLRCDGIGPKSRRAADMLTLV